MQAVGRAARPWCAAQQLPQPGHQLLRQAAAFHRSKNAYTASHGVMWNLRPRQVAV